MKLATAIACASLAIACGGSSGNSSGGGGGPSTCIDIAGTYTGAEAFTASTCASAKVGTLADPATLTISQTAGSCTFTMTNSLVSGVTFSGTIDPSTNAVTWTSSPSPYPQNDGYVTVSNVAMKVTAKPAPQVASLDGTFDWTWASTATGTAYCGGTTSFSDYVQ